MQIVKLVQRVDNIETECRNVILNRYNYAFKGLGKFPGEPYRIELKESVIPIINSPRQFPQAIINELK